MIIKFLLSSNSEENNGELLGLKRDKLLSQSQELFSEVNKKILEYFREKVENEKQ